MGKIAVAVALSVFVMAGPCMADVIGSQVTVREKNTDPAVVAKRLSDLGVHKDNIRQQVGALTDRDLAYFSEKPGRLRLAGQEGGGQGEFMSGSGEPLWYEWVLGAVALTGAVVVMIVAVNNNE